MVAFDLIIFAVIAAGLVLWLKNVLGTRHGSEREIPNPYAKAANDAAEAALDDTIKTLPTNTLNPIRNAVEKTAQAGLTQIQNTDLSFNLSHFIQGAEKAFPMIVEAFAKGERRVLQKLLSAGVYNDFEAAIKARELRGETQITDVHAVRRADIIEAKIEGGQALIAVRFVADETAVTRNKAGDIVAGSPERIIEMVDVWVFGRSARSTNQMWQLVETRDDKTEPAGATPIPDSKG